MNTLFITPDPTRAFEAACRSFLTSPDENTLLLLQVTASPLMGGTRGQTGQVIATVPAPAPADANPWYAPDDHPGDWYSIRAEFDRILSSGEVWLASGALGYALRTTINGESLSDPSECVQRRTSDNKPVTVIYYGYDSTKSRRDDCHTVEAFELAKEYIRDGSPIRMTDRAGAGTRGTRLCPGIGEVGVTFSVR
jgi:hypothetical protein